MKPWQKIVLVILGTGLVIAGIYLFRQSRPDQTTEQTGARQLADAPTPTENNFTFAVMADIHSDWESFKKGLEMAKSDGVDVVIVNGDLTTIGQKEELLAAKKILDEGGLPYYVLSGNHDIYLSQKMKVDLFAEVFGPPITSFEKNNFLFILIPQGELPGKTIERCLLITCLVFVHEPPYHPTSDHIMEPAKALKLLKLLKNNQAKTIFTGHLHYNMEYEFNGLRTIISGALGRERNLQSPRFLEYTPLTGEVKTVILN
ncbi:MAG: metallophosphoesterase [Candidatus Shapirobacteria bacterium]